MLDDLLDLLTETIRHSRPVSRDIYGKAIYGAPTAYPARIVYKRRLVRDAKGDQQVSKCEAWISRIANVSLDDKIVFNDNSSLQILAVEAYPDEAGTSHVKVYFT